MWHATKRLWVPSIGQNLQPFIGNGDISTWMKISRVETNIQINKQTGLSSFLIQLFHFVMYYKHVLTSFFHKRRTSCSSCCFQGEYYISSAGFCVQTYIQTVLMWRDLFQFIFVFKHIFKTVSFGSNTYLIFFFKSRLPIEKIAAFDTINENLPDNHAFLYVILINQLYQRHIRLVFHKVVNIFITNPTSI